MAKKPLGLALDEELIARVDRARGDVSRTRWIERAIGQALPDCGPEMVPTPHQRRELEALENQVKKPERSFTDELKAITEGWKRDGISGDGS